MWILVPALVGWKVQKTEMFQLISLVSLQPKRPFTLSRISLSGANLFFYCFIPWLRNKPPLCMCLAWYPKCFHLLHLMCSTQSSAQRGQTLLTEKTETQRGQMITPGSTSRDDHMHLLIPSSAQTDIIYDWKNWQRRKLLFPRYMTTSYCICIMSYR